MKRHLDRSSSCELVSSYHWGCVGVSPLSAAAHANSWLMFGKQCRSNCSHEKLDKGLTHAFFLTFADEAGRLGITCGAAVCFSHQAARDNYLVHPLHEETGQLFKIGMNRTLNLKAMWKIGQEFVAAYKPRLQDVCVIDYLAESSENLWTVWRKIVPWRSFAGGLSPWSFVIRLWARFHLQGQAAQRLLLPSAILLGGRRSEEPPKGREVGWNFFHSISFATKMEPRKKKRFCVFFSRCCCEWRPQVAWLPKSWQGGTLQGPSDTIRKSTCQVFSIVVIFFQIYLIAVRPIECHWWCHSLSLRFNSLCDHLCEGKVCSPSQHLEGNDHNARTWRYSETSSD